MEETSVGAERSETGEEPSDGTPPAGPVGRSASSLPDDPVDLEVVIAAEQAAIKDSREVLHILQGAALLPTGLSLSGGGIRSACFNLGLLEGLDRFRYDVALEDQPANDLLRPNPGTATGHNFLEYFDYVSSVSGGSYASGHLATAMLEQERNRAQSPAEQEWLGKVQLTSKTVPGWLWGLGVWSLGVAFQLLKTGALLVWLLAAVAFAMRIADSPDVMRFIGVMGLGSDVTRGFVPFWLVVWIFLVAYWINASKQPKWVTLRLDVLVRRARRDLLSRRLGVLVGASRPGGERLAAVRFPLLLPVAARHARRRLFRGPRAVPVRQVVDGSFPRARARRNPPRDGRGPGKVLSSNCTSR